VRNRLAAARCMAFLHDLTHAPYGHTLEDEIHLVS
jgi:HD superfamily phosphohydrolase